MALGMKGVGIRDCVGRGGMTSPQFRWVSWLEALSKLPSGGAADGGRWHAEMPAVPGDLFSGWGADEGWGLQVWTEGRQ